MVIKRNAFTFCGILCVFMEIFKMFNANVEMINVISSWLLCIYIAISCVCLLIYSVENKECIKQLVMYIGLFLLCVLGRILHGKMYKANMMYIEITVLILLMTMISVFYFELKKLRFTEMLAEEFEIKKYLEKNILKSTDKEAKGVFFNAISIYLIIAIAFFQTLRPYYLYISFLGIVLFYLVLITVSVAKFYFLKKFNYRNLIDLFLILVEIILSVIFESRNIDFYFLIMQVLLCMPYISSAINMNNYKKITNQTPEK